jgi:hypothetical protein
MPSVILTKINTVQLRFADQISAFQRTGDMAFLHQFVNYMHKNADVIPDISTIEACTSKGSYLYRIYPEYIVRTDLNTQSKKTYKIS